jgi:hypothetical protein
VSSPRQLELPERVLARVVAELRPLEGVRALALGGSWARGTARPDSDLDVGLYYREAAPFRVEAVRSSAQRLDPRPERVVTGFGEWGPWVDGGAWLVVDGQRVDLLYRSLDQLERTLAAAERGEHQWHFGQQPPFGFHSYVLLGELSICRPRHDPEGELARLRRRVERYPEPLRAAVVQDLLWNAEFSLLHARGFAARGDVVNTAGCLTRIAACLVQVVFAWNRRWFVSDKGALETIDAGLEAPPGFGAELAALLAAPGASAGELTRTLARMRALCESVATLCSELYRPRFALGGDRPPGAAPASSENHQ